MREIIGAFLISLPFLVILGFMCKDIGRRGAAIILGITLAILGCFVGGVLLLNGKITW